MSDRENPSYTCPGCIANDMREDCFHGPLDWVLAEAMLAGVKQLHPESAPHAGLTAWDFADDAEAVREKVGPPPYSVNFTHPGGDLASVGLVNQRYLIGLPDDEGDSPAMFICDIDALTNTEPIRREET